MKSAIKLQFRSKTQVSAYWGSLPLRRERPRLRDRVRDAIADWHPLDAYAARVLYRLGRRFLRAYHDAIFDGHHMPVGLLVYSFFALIAFVALK